MQLYREYKTTKYGQVGTGLAVNVLSVIAVINHCKQKTILSKLICR